MNARSFVVPIALLVLCSCGGGGSGASVAATAVAAPSPAASPSPSPSPAVSSGPASSAAAPASVTSTIGPGFSDVSPHQIVRSSADVVYAATPSCPTFSTCNGNALIMYGGNGSGTTSSMTPLDTADEPVAAGSSDAIGTSAIAIDAHDVVWVAWIARANGGSVDVATFDTATQKWSAPTLLQTTGYTSFTQGNEGVALALDAGGAPHVAYSAADASGQFHIRYANRVSGSWSTPVQVDDESIPSGSNATHPTLAFAPDGSLLFAWLDGSYNYSPGTARTRVRSASGTFAASTAISSGQVADTIDNGPSLLVTADGTRHITFIDNGANVKYWYSSDGITWHGDRQPAIQESHDPSLGPDGAGGIYIYGHGTPQGAIDGIGQNLYRFHLASGSTVWSPFALYVTGTYDCSVSTRWSQFFMNYPAELDVLYWDSGTVPNQLYLGEG